MATNCHRADNLGASADIHMAFNSWGAPAARTDRHLLKYETIRADLGVWMNHDTVRMRHQQPSTQPAVQWHICACDDTPPAIAQDSQRAWPRAPPIRGYRVPLVIADAGQ